MTARYKFPHPPPPTDGEYVLLGDACEALGISFMGGTDLANDGALRLWMEIGMIARIEQASIDRLLAQPRKTALDPYWPTVPQVASHLDMRPRDVHALIENGVLRSRVDWNIDPPIVEVDPESVADLAGKAPADLEDLTDKAATQEPGNNSGQRDV